MPFIDVLNEIIAKVPKAVGAIIVDFEGESVQHARVRIDDHELKLIGAYQVLHFNNIREAHHHTETFITKADDLDIISMRLDDEYFVSLVLQKGALLGRAEFVLKSNLNAIRELM